jgi:protein-disulfide isomerase
VADAPLIGVARPEPLAMASRKEQKEAARARRLAEEQARAARARRDRRLRMVAGTVIAGAAVVAVLIAVSSSSNSTAAPKLNTPAAKQAATSVNNLLAGIPQSGQTLGSPHAKVTVTEFGDLKCPVCQAFALGAESQLISNEVRSGKVKLIYRSLCTATCNGPQPGVFNTQQAAANAAGVQNKAWYYIQNFYHLQGNEQTAYVTPAFLSGIASLVPGLDYSKWKSDSGSAAMNAQVNADKALAAQKGLSSTPTLLVSGPKGEASPIVGDTSYAQLQSTIKSVQ